MINEIESKLAATESLHGTISGKKDLTAELSPTGVFSAKTGAILRCETYAGKGYPQGGMQIYISPIVSNSYNYDGTTPESYMTSLYAVDKN